MTGKRHSELLLVIFFEGIWAFGIYHVYTNQEFYRADTWLVFNRYDALIIVMPLAFAFMLWLTFAAVRDLSRANSR